MHVAFALFASLALAAPPSSPSSPSQGTPTSSGYSGHGAASVDAALVERFRAAPLAGDLSRRVQAMLDVRAPSGGVLSPDGRTLFFTWTVTGTKQVWRVDGPMRFPVQMTGGEDATSVVAVTHDGRFLVVSRDRKGEENPGLYLQDVHGGRLIAVQHKPGVQTLAQHLSDDGRTLYYRANDDRPDAYTLYRFDLATRTTTRVFGGDALWQMLDRRVDATTKHPMLLLGKEVGGNMLEVFELDEETGALAALFGQGEREDYVASYGNDDDVLVLTPHFGDARRLYRWRRARGASAAGFDAITPSQRWDIESFTIDRAHTRILTSTNEGGFSRPSAYDARTLRPLVLPTLPHGDHVQWGATTRDGRFTVVTVDPGTRPIESVVLDWRSATETEWHVPAAPEVDLASFVPVTLESYPARDGTPIPMLVRRPRACVTSSSTATPPCPVIVDFHGGPEGQARAGFNVRAQLFVDAGFVVVQPNVRGSDGYGKAWLHADDARKRLDVVTDIEDAAVFIRRAWARGGVAPRIGIMGGSYGGYSTLMGMTRFAGAYDAGVEVVGISNLVTFLLNTAPYRRALRISEYGDPVADRDALLQLSPITYVEATRAPLLLVQGATDPRVPVGEAVQMYEALQRKGLPSTMILFPDEGHGVQKRDNVVQYLGHALGFFEQHLKAGHAAAGPTTTAAPR